MIGVSIFVVGRSVSQYGLPVAVYMKLRPKYLNNWSFIFCCGRWLLPCMFYKKLRINNCNNRSFIFRCGQARSLYGLPVAVYMKLPANQKGFSIFVVAGRVQNMVCPWQLYEHESATAVGIIKNRSLPAIPYSGHHFRPLHQE